MKLTININKPQCRIYWAVMGSDCDYFEQYPENLDYIHANNINRIRDVYRFDYAIYILLSCDRKFRETMLESDDTWKVEYITSTYKGETEIEMSDYETFQESLISILHDEKWIADLDVFNFISAMVKSGKLELTKEENTILNNEQEAQEDWREDAEHDYQRILRGSL